MSTDSPFASIPSPLRRALEERGFESLTVVQQAVVETLAATDTQKNLRVSSQTGSGKTIAIGIAIAQQLLEETETDVKLVGPRALIITPTRELAAQVQAELDWLYKFAKLRTDVVTGGTDVRGEKRRLSHPPDVLVGTPGRLLDHINSKALNCSQIATVVLDEADQMLDMGFKDELDAIVSELPEERLSHLVSATFSGAVRQLAKRFQGDATIVEGTKLGAANADIEHIAYLVDGRERYAALVNLLLTHWGERCLVFVQTRSDASELSERLAEDGFSALPFSGDLAQAQRTRTLNAFRTGIVNTLIATDVAARGIDVPNISVVIHGDLPKEPDVYTHRSGRTGRAGQTGSSLSIVVPRNESRTRRLLSMAKVDVKWESVPTAKKINLRITKATRRALYDELQAQEPEASELEYAQQLLEKEDPAKVLATLLRMAAKRLPREPFDLKTPTPSQQRDARPRGARPEQFTRYFVNWGAKTGANTNRILSHVCRRGEITSSDIGTIEVNTHGTLIEVNTAVSATFERLVKKPDERDPLVTITVDRSVPPRPAGARAPRRAPPVPPRTRPDAAAGNTQRVMRADRGKRVRRVQDGE